MTNFKEKLEEILLREGGKLYKKGYHLAESKAYPELNAIVKEIKQLILDEAIGKDIDYHDEDKEVVGNMWENPELLEGKG